MTDTIETITLDEYPDVRARVILDEYAECPYDDGSSPILAYSRRGVQQETRTTSYAVSDRIIEAANRWPMETAKFDRYLIIFHGTTEIDEWSTDDADYVTFDTAEWREAMGIPEDLAAWRASNPDAKLANADEYRAWLEGGSYMIVVERRIWKATVDRDLIPDLDSVGDEWEHVDSLSGLYGDLDGYVTEQAHEMIRENAGEVG